MKQDFEFNEKPCSVNRLGLECEDGWSLGQQEAVRRLSIKTRVEFKQTARFELIKDFSIRAERIAGNYARIYLELEQNGKPELQGRFYWTGLAAFASKQVMCALDYSSLSKWRYTGVAIPFFDRTKSHLGKGNFWLFQDIFVWHWFYINFPDEFMECKDKRDWNTYPECFRNAFKELPWVDDALPTINYFKVTPDLADGFNFISETENLPLSKLRRDTQYESLLAIARHEQLMILQPLIYESLDFKALLRSQSVMEGHIGVPRRLAALSTHCETNNPEYDIVMTEGQLYNKGDRMNFITEIAQNYHSLMNQKPDYMKQSIQDISEWSNNV
ncbi:DUF2515 family protein [Pseudomonas sp. SMSB3]|uniref:DUF2515 family protein n=1 Tax=Pseudomonas sp. SMSB3 TaxID=3390196 RepID=UPI003F8477A6